MKGKDPVSGKVSHSGQSQLQQDSGHAPSEGVQVDHDASMTERASTDERGPADGDREIGGRDGPDPTRFGDWEKNGRCIDF